MKYDRSSVGGRSVTTHFRKLVGKKNVRITNFDAGMHDAGIRRGMATEILGAESTLIELDCFGGAFYHQMRCEGMHTLRNWFCGWRHSYSFHVRKVLCGLKIIRRSRVASCARGRSFPVEEEHSEIRQQILRSQWSGRAQGQSTPCRCGRRIRFRRN